MAEDEKDFKHREEKRIAKLVERQKVNQQKQDAYLERQRKRNLFCELCDMNGHSTDECGHRCNNKNCAKDPIHTRNACERRTTCEKCGKFGHLTKECTRIFCLICGLDNHATQNCMARQRCKVKNCITGKHAHKYISGNCQTRN